MTYSDTADLNVAVELRIGQGNFDQGFPITLKIYKDGVLIDDKLCDRLPRAPEIPQLYKKWALDYDKLGQLATDSNHANAQFIPTPSSQLDDNTEKSEWDSGHLRAPVPAEGQVKNKSAIEDCRVSARNLETYIKEEWFKHPALRVLSADICGHDYVQRDRSIPIIFSFVTGNPEINDLLRKLPWHLWSLFQVLDQAEVCLDTGISEKSLKLENPVRILAIFGGNPEMSKGNPEMSKGLRLNLKEDKKALEDIVSSKATIKFIPEAGKQLTVEELHNTIRDREGWDIIFYTGHSASDSKDGYLLINENHSVRISDLEEDFRVALRNGLKLAIFNSCQGLGIADFFAGWSDQNMFVNYPTPNLIVMREPVPDFVARRFFREFLSEFVHDVSIHTAVRAARSRLATLQVWDRIPYICASWLPIVCLSPSYELTWPKATPVPPTPPAPPTPPVPPTPLVPSSLLKVVGGVVLAAAVSFVAIKLFRSDQTAASDLGSSLEPDYISLGEDRLIDSTIWQDEESSAYAGCFPNRGLKEDAIAAFREASEAEAGLGRWGIVVEQFEQYREVCSADPEALIYLNNARVFESGQPIIRLAAVVALGHRETVGYSQELLRGYAHAQEIINQSEDGVSGRLVQIQIADDTPGSSDTDKHELTEDIAALLKIDPAVVASLTHTSDTTQRASDLYTESGLISISSMSTAVRDEQFRLDEDHVFRTANTDKRAAKDIASTIQARGYDTVGMVYKSDDDYSRSIKRQSEFALDGLVDEISAPDVCDLAYGKFSANGCANQLADLDAVILLPSAEVGSRIQQVVLNLFNFDQSPDLFGGDAVFGGNTLQEIGAKAEGMIVAIPWHQNVNNGEANRFLEEAQGIWGISRDGFNWRTALSFDSAMAVTGAIAQMNLPPAEESEGDILTRQEVKGLGDVLKNNSFDGFLGENTVSFDQSGDRELSDDLDLGAIVEVQCSDDQCSFGKPNN